MGGSVRGMYRGLGVGPYFQGRVSLGRDTLATSALSIPGMGDLQGIKPLQLARMLQVALNGKNGPDLLMSLPSAGVDGTMRLRLRNTAAQGWARVKTGTLRNVAALAGLVPDAEGRRWVMVAFVNAEQAPARGRPVLDSLVNWIASGGPLSRASSTTGPQNEGP